MAAKIYVLISWPDGSRVINIENIKEPRKPFHHYSVGEQVLARCPGFSGLYWGIVEGISGKYNPSIYNIVFWAGFSKAVSIMSLYLLPVIGNCLDVCSKRNFQIHPEILHLI